MADKVYGFCGRNKCKREVFDVSRVVKVNTLANPTGTSNISYPEGFNVRNCIVLSVESGRMASGNPAIYAPSVTVTLGISNVIVSFGESMPVGTNINIWLLRVSD